MQVPWLYTWSTETPQTRHYLRIVSTLICRAWGFPGALRTPIGTLVTALVPYLMMWQTKTIAFSLWIHIKITERHNEEKQVHIT